MVLNSTILSSLSLFSYNISLNFFKKSVKNSFFSPYSLFIALLLTSSVDQNASPSILKYFNYSDTSVSSIDQVNNLLFLAKSIETVPSCLNFTNSSSFANFISKYNFTNDQKYISFEILNHLIEQSKQNSSLNREELFSNILEQIENDSNESISNQIAQKYKMILENDVMQYPIISSSNYLFINNMTNFSVPDLISTEYQQFIYKTEFPKPGYLEINKLVKESTRGLISDFISASDLPPSTPYFIANTIYFKGLWEIPMKLLNWQIEFNSISGKSKKIDFLKAKNDFEFYEDEDLIYVNLNYRHSSFSFEIVMPKNIKNFDSIRNKLYGDDHLLNTISKYTTKSNVLLMIPKFTMKTDLMDFSHILNIRGVDSVIQKAVIIVDEKGTEAAAASGISVRSIELDQPRELIINQPFMFLIRDRNKNLPIFIGEFVKPIE